jgi:hypothetical protein
MTHEQLFRLKCHEDVTLLDGLQHEWLWFNLGKLLETDPFEREYYRRLAKTADELIVQQQAKMVRRYL